MTDKRTGGCLCGAVRYESEGDPVFSLQCHCRDCQRSSGTAYIAAMRVPAAGFRITQGAPKRYVGKADSGNEIIRAFCGDCGSPLFSRRELTPENTALRIGTLDAEHAGGMRITANIWTRSARSWAHIDPATEQFAGQPDAPTKR